MVSEGMHFVPPQRTENGLSSHMMFQDEGLRFSRPGGDPASDPVRKPRAVASPGLVMNNEKPLFSLDREGGFFRSQGMELQRSIYGSSCRTGQEYQVHNQEWNAEGSNGTPSGEGSDVREDERDEDDEDNDEDDVDEGDGEVEGLVSMDNGNAKNHNNSSGSVQSTSEKIHNEKAMFLEHHSSFGTNRGMMMKDGSNGIRGDLNEQLHQQGRMGHYENAVVLGEPDMYYAQFLQGGDGSALAQKEVGGDNGSIFSGRKDIALSLDTGNSIRMHLSDPVTGTLMDDAMILPCGHSFGSNGIQHVIRMKACFKCGHSISEESVRPNLAVRSAVQAFRREEKSQSSKASKRRRERFEQDKCNYEDPLPVDLPKGKGVQFPFVVSDRVIIKGNKRTPQRFVGRVAVVTTQCLNGWYVVKTLDNAESVKLQYRSLAKFTDDVPSDMISSKAMAPNWL